MLTNEEIRHEAARVLQGEDFQQYVPKKETFDFWQWLLKHLNWKFPFETGGSAAIWSAIGLVMKGILFLGVAGVLCYLLYYLFYRFKQKRQSEASEVWGVTENARRIAQESYSRLAAEALGRQNYRDAIHYLFLATVSMVIRDMYFYGTEFMTNREISQSTDFSRFPQSQNLTDIFREMVHFDEPRWFGATEVTLADYEAFVSYYNVFNRQVKVQDA